MVPVKLYPGDILAFRASFPAIFLNQCVSPVTDRWHFALLVSYHHGEKDWIIYESLKDKGVRIGRLSWYTNESIEIYRVDKLMGDDVVYEASLYGRAGYDTTLISRMACEIGRYWRRHGIRRVPCDELHDRPNGTLVCTELVTRSYNRYVSLIPNGVAATPAAMKQSYLEGKMELVFRGFVGLEHFR